MAKRGNIDIELSAELQDFLKNGDKKFQKAASRAVTDAQRRGRAIVQRRVTEEFAVKPSAFKTRVKIKAHRRFRKGVLTAVTLEYSGRKLNAGQFKKMKPASPRKPVNLRKARVVYFEPTGKRPGGFVTLRRWARPITYSWQYRRNTTHEAKPGPGVHYFLRKGKTGVSLVRKTDPDAGKPVYTAVTEKSIPEMISDAGVEKAIGDDIVDLLQKRLDHYVSRIR